MIPMKGAAKTFSQTIFTVLVLLLQIAFLTQTYAFVNASNEEEHQDFNFIAYGDTRSSDRPDAVSPFHEGIVQALNPNPCL